MSENGSRRQVLFRLPDATQRKLVERAKLEGRTVQVVLERFAAAYAAGELECPVQEQGAAS